MSCLSVRSERLFPTADNIVNKKRAAPDPDHVNRLVFLANKIKELIYCDIIGLTLAVSCLVGTLLLRCEVLIQFSFSLIA